MDELAGLAGHTLMEHRLYVKRDVTARPFFLLILWLQRLDVASAGENMVVKALWAEILKADVRLFHGPVDHSAVLAQFGIVAEIGPLVFSEAIFIVESFATIYKNLSFFLFFFIFIINRCISAHILQQVCMAALEAFLRTSCIVLGNLCRASVHLSTASRRPNNMAVQK
jgi:hypothetical protein